MAKSLRGQLQHVYTKRQGTVATATFGSEFVAARITTDQIVDLRYTQIYLGFPTRAKVTCLVTTNLQLTVPAFLLQPYQRNQPWILIIESEKPLLLDISNSTGRMAIQHRSHLEQTLIICKYSATLETSTLLERRYK